MPSQLIKNNKHEHFLNDEEERKKRNYCFCYLTVINYNYCCKVRFKAVNTMVFSIRAIKKDKMEPTNFRFLEDKMKGYLTT